MRTGWNNDKKNKSANTATAGMSANEEPPAMPSVALKATSASDSAASFAAKMYSGSNSQFEIF